MTVRVAIWTCVRCDRVYEGKWEGVCYMMASECPYCGGTGMSNETFSRPTGTLFIEKEKKIS